MNEYWNNLLNFCINHKKNYIYGCGDYGAIIFDYLEQEGVSVDAFLETEPKRAVRRGIPVFKSTSKDVLYDNNTGIVLAMRNDFRDEVIDYLNEFIDVDIFYLSDDQYEHLRNRTGNKFDFYYKASNYLSQYPADRELHMNMWNRILIVQLDFLGDIIWSTPFIRELRRNFPNADIEIIVTKNNGKVLENCPYLNSVHVIDAPTSDICRDFYQFEEKCNNMKKYYTNEFGNKKFDVCFLTRNLSMNDKIESIFLSLHSGARQRIGWGFVNNLNVRFYEPEFLNVLSDFFTRYVGELRIRHYVECRLDMLRICGLKVEDTYQELWPMNYEYYSRQFLAEHSIKQNDLILVVGINGSRPAKNWDIKKYVKAMVGLNERIESKIFFIIAGDKEALDRAIEVEGVPGCINMVGKTSINDLINIVKLSSGYLGADTGIGHIAATFGKPTIVLSPHISGESGFCQELVAPRGGRVEFIHPSQGLGGCIGACRVNHSHCINQIEPEDVISSVIRLLEEK